MPKIHCPNPNPALPVIPPNLNVYPNTSRAGVPPKAEVTPIYVILAAMPVTMGIKNRRRDVPLVRMASPMVRLI